MKYNLGDRFKIKNPDAPFRTTLRYELVKYIEGADKPYILACDDCPGRPYANTERQIDKHLMRIEGE